MTALGSYSHHLIFILFYCLKIFETDAARLGSVAWLIREINLVQMLVRWKRSHLEEEKDPTDPNKKRLQRQFIRYKPRIVFDEYFTNLQNKNWGDLTDWKQHPMTALDFVDNFLQMWGIICTNCWHFSQFLNVFFDLPR